MKFHKQRQTSNYLANLQRFRTKLKTIRVIIRNKNNKTNKIQSSKRLKSNHQRTSKIFLVLLPIFLDLIDSVMVLEFLLIMEPMELVQTCLGMAISSLKRTQYHKLHKLNQKWRNLPVLFLELLKVYLTFQPMVYLLSKNRWLGKNPKEMKMMEIAQS